MSIKPLCVIIRIILKQFQALKEFIRFRSIYDWQQKAQQVTP